MAEENPYARNRNSGYPGVSTGPATGEAPAQEHRRAQFESSFRRMKFLAAGVVLFLVVLVGLILSFVLGYKDEPEFLQAMAALRANPQAIAALGEPLDDDFQMSFSTKNGRTQFTGGVSGPRASGELNYVAVERSDGSVRFEHLYLRVGEEHIDLIDSLPPRQ